MCEIVLSVFIRTYPRHPRFDFLWLRPEAALGILWRRRTKSLTWADILPPFRRVPMWSLAKSGSEQNPGTVMFRRGPELRACRSAVARAPLDHPQMRDSPHKHRRFRLRCFP
jgi:hypothetical protein